MAITLNGTTGITTPAETVNGNETVTGDLIVGGNETIAGNLTVTGLINANGGGLIKSGTLISTATTTFTGSAVITSTALTASASIVGTIQIGQVIAGTGIAAGTSIIAQVSGTTGGAGVYTLSQATTGAVSGTITVVGVDFYNIPSYVKRVTVMFNGVSAAGSSIPLYVQLGTTLGIENTGYVCNVGVLTGGYPGAVGVDTTVITGFQLEYQAQAVGDILSGHLVLTNVSGNIWVGSGSIGSTSGGNRSIYFYTGSKTTAATLDRVRITTAGGTATFDAGSINILYE